MIPIALTDRRKEIEALAHVYDPALAERLGILLVEQRDHTNDRKEERHCHWYTFGNSWAYIINGDPSPIGYYSTDSLENTVIALYYHSSQLDPALHILKPKITHSGKVQRYGMIISKFTHG